MKKTHLKAGTWNLVGGEPPPTKKGNFHVRDHNYFPEQPTNNVYDIK